MFGQKNTLCTQQGSSTSSSNLEKKDIAELAMIIENSIENGTMFSSWLGSMLPMKCEIP